MVPENPIKRSHRYVTYYDRDSATSLPMILANALAEVLDVDATEGEQVLYASVNPTSLDNLFKDQFDATLREQGHITLTVDEYLIVVSSEGRIEISPRSNLEE